MNMEANREDKCESESGLPPQESRRRSSVLKKLSSFGIATLEKFFYRWGFTVATHPLKFITACLLITTICGSGLIYFKEEMRPDKLILPLDTEYARNTEWIRSHSPVPLRENLAAVSAKNVLTPEVMLLLLDLHETVRSISSPNGETWDDVCFRLPVTKFDIGEQDDDEHHHRRRKRSIAGTAQQNSAFTSSKSNNSDHDVSDFEDDFFNEDDTNRTTPKPRKFESYHAMSESLYCSIMESLDEECWEINPIELWSYDRDKIKSLTQEEIIHVYNHQLLSPVFGRKSKYHLQLGGNVQRNEKGEIVKAESLMLMWPVKVDTTKEMVTDAHGMVGDAGGLNWEKVWIKAMKNFSTRLPPGITFDFANLSSWADILDQTLIEEGLVLGCGFIIMFVYVGLMLGKMNVVEQRPFLTCGGLGAILMSLIVSCGLCSFIGVKFTPLTRIMGFLMLGIGIDDMFVIVQCWNNLYPNTFQQKYKRPLPERIGLALKHSGVSVTITSLTDIAAFMAGALTPIPSLRSFCIYAVFGISALYVFQATFFVACFAIDQRRIESRRNAFFPWIKYSEEEIASLSSSSSKNLLQSFFDKGLSKFLMLKKFKVLVILSTLTLLAAGIYGSIKLRQHSDPMWFLPEDSYLVKYFRNHKEKYPDWGLPGVVVAHEVNWTQSLVPFGTFVEELQKSPYLYEVKQFYSEFRTFVADEYKIDIGDRILSQKEFDKYLGRFLFSPYGVPYKYFFKLQNGTSFQCGGSIPPIETVIVPFYFKFFHNGSQEHVPAMHSIKKLVRDVGTDITFNANPKSDQPTFFFWAQISLAWEVDEIIKAEMYKNLGLSMACVLVVTLILLADFRMCLMCAVCIIFTVINITGFMHFWGLTIDSVACTILVLAVGLCVDYAVHICLAFMSSSKPTRSQKAEEALRAMGPAVFNGGFSTFLGLVLLCKARTVASFSFFKIFTLVVGFGLFHGLIFLPVLLSIFGTKNSNPTKREENKSPKAVEMCCLTGDDSSASSSCGGIHQDDDDNEIHISSNSFLESKEESA